MKKIVWVKNFLNAGNTSSFTLSPERQHREDILFSVEEKQRFIAAEKITLALIDRFFGIQDVEICGMVSQKPYIKNHRNIGFSRSYCGSALCVAAEDTERIGVDSEEIKKADESVMKYFFTDKEKAFVNCCPNQDLAFALIWTRKESYIKCIGKGLCFPMDLLDVTPVKSNSISLPTAIKSAEFGDLFISSYRIDSAVVSVCSEKEDGFPQRLEEWS